MGQVKLCKRGHERTPENVYKNGNCKLCLREKLTELGRRQYLRSQQRKDDIARKRRKLIAKTLPDSYIASYLGIPTQMVPAELLEIKRLTIQLQRSLKNGSQEQRDNH